MNNSDIELKMLANIPIPIGNSGIEFHIPTLKEIIKIGENRYNSLISLLLINKDTIKGLKNPDELTNFDITYVNCYYSETFWNDFKQAMYIFFKDEVFMSPEDLGLFFYFGDITENKRLDNNNFDLIQELVKVANNVKFEEEEYNPAGEKTKSFINEIKKIKSEILKIKEPMFSLASKISGIAWKSNNINIFNVFEMNIFQFYDALLRLDQVDNYQFTLSGMYAGTVDGNQINMSNLHWTKKVKY
ncbi:hypothetical protein [Heyndrickxia oleronia]|jgi:hypothetical protein|uniref:hypothetical protein n=1 Tax=Heyndrickxia oleronia TaxID=38875 RepID=UPI00242CC57A|nr:hypothetical protein [Heyndrickxia oleronia]MCI1763638.1 hypothetical protein [Heyndrickxia oleronia]